MNAAPIILCWTTGVLVGLTYLATSQFLFWSGLAAVLLVLMIFGNFRYGFYLMMLFVPIDISQVAITLPNFLYIPSDVLPLFHTPVYYVYGMAVL
jgi:hypothetical protein